MKVDREGLMSTLLAGSVSVVVSHVKRRPLEGCTLSLSLVVQATRSTSESVIVVLETYPRLSRSSSCG